MIKFLSPHRLFSSGSPANADKLSKTFNQLPWNFNAYLLNKEAENLEAPVDLGSGIPNSVQATTLFKSFVEAIHENDMSLIEDQMEPSMLIKTANKVDEAHRALKKQGLELRVQNLRGGHQVHDSEFFLYNVQNYLLCGDVKLDRSCNKPETAFLLEEKQDINVND